MTTTVVCFLVTLMMTRADPDLTWRSDDVTGQEARVDVKKKQIGLRLCGPADRDYSFNPSAPNGPNNWGRVSWCCDGFLQSPVHVTRQTARCGEVMGSVLYSTVLPVPGIIYNTGLIGKYPKMSFYGRVELTNVPGTNFRDRYVLDSLHVHFGNSRQVGSEHRVNGRFYDGELHLVHYKDTYRSLDDAMSREDGVAVIGLMLELVPDTSGPNWALWNMTMNMGRLLGVGSRYSRDHEVNPKWLFPMRPDFFTYRGSLTGPPCSESVRWIVMEEPVKITREMLNVYWNLPSDEGRLISDYTNVRAVYPTGNRMVQTNFFC
ncbi:hypothetical protein BaRGS_00017785 [Batillaria attramentaria]|uniref:Carbonic anhydrase n=1 Tax=Batillaria attramentaria TaxID=370345 RepID=A0ABD0KUF3_9CAEN